MENDIFWSEIGSGFVEPGGTLPLRIPRSTPWAQGKFSRFQGGFIALSS